MLAADPSRDPSWPPSYSPDLAKRILDRIAQGEALMAICRDEPGAPSEMTVRRWAIDDVNGFASEYARARDQGVDALVDQTVTIADESGFDVVIGDDGTVRVDGDVINRAKLRVDTRKWYASKLAPKKYGDRLQVDATVEHRYAAMDDRELVATMRDLADRLGFVAPPMLPVLLGVADKTEDEPS